MRGKDEDGGAKRYVIDGPALKKHEGKEMLGFMNKGLKWIGGRMEKDEVSDNTVYRFFGDDGEEIKEKKLICENLIWTEWGRKPSIVNKRKIEPIPETNRHDRQMPHVSGNSPMSSSTFKNTEKGRPFNIPITIERSLSPRVQRDVKKPFPEWSNDIEGPGLSGMSMGIESLSSSQRSNMFEIPITKKTSVTERPSFSERSKLFDNNGRLNGAQRSPFSSAGSKEIEIPVIKTSTSSRSNLFEIPVTTTAVNSQKHQATSKNITARFSDFNTSTGQQQQSSDKKEITIPVGSNNVTIKGISSEAATYTKSEEIKDGKKIIKLNIKY